MKAQGFFTGGLAGVCQAIGAIMFCVVIREELNQEQKSSDRKKMKVLEAFTSFLFTSPRIFS